MTPSHKKPITATKMAARTAIILLVFVAIFTGFLSGAYLWTRPAIETAANEERMKLIASAWPGRANHRLSGAQGQPTGGAGI
jgi:electron transport complex protein RnfG